MPAQAKLYNVVGCEETPNTHTHTHTHKIYPTMSIKILCCCNIQRTTSIMLLPMSLSRRGAGVDAAGLNAVRPLHRAAVEGLVTILGTLLERGASANDLDSNL